MKKCLTIIAVVVFFSQNAQAACSVKMVTDAEGEYSGCEVTVDGSTQRENISENACEAICQVKKAQAMADSTTTGAMLKAMERKTPSNSPNPASAVTE